MKESTISMENGTLIIEFWTKGKILKHERRKREMPLEEVSEFGNISSGFLSQIENGKRGCSDELFLKLLVQAFKFKKDIAKKILKECQKDIHKINAIKSIYQL